MIESLTHQLVASIAAVVKESVESVVSGALRYERQAMLHADGGLQAPLGESGGHSQRPAACHGWLHSSMRV